MPICEECGTHWFNPAIHKCPVCGTLTIEGLAGALSDQIRRVPDLLKDPRVLGEQLFSDDPVVRKAALDVLAKAQTRSALICFFLLDARHEMTLAMTLYARSTTTHSMLKNLFPSCWPWHPNQMTVVIVRVWPSLLLGIWANLPFLI